MKRKKIISLSLIAALSLGIGVSAYAEEENVSEDSYYVCFSYDNYQVKNTNKMTGIDEDSDGTIDYYKLSNKSLSSSMDFYVVNQNEEKFYASDGANMKVEDSDSYKYNIIFNKNYVYDETHTEGTDYYVSNANITYDYYIPGNYALDVNGTINNDFAYNHYVTSYDAYILPEVSLHKGDIITVTDKDTSEDGLVTYTKTIENDGNYRIVFTPTSKKNGDEYRFDTDGNYGSGDEYTENFAISDVEYYYIAYTSDENLHFNENTTTFSYNGTDVTGYRLVKDETKPLATVFEGDTFFNNKEKHKITYKVYHYSYIFNTYELIDDDNDSDTEESETKLSDISWYKPSFTYAEGRYTTAFTTETVDFGGYYMIGEFNNYGFNADGSLNLSSEYEFETIDETSSYYDKDNKQFILKDFTITRETLNKDVDEYSYDFYISNGKNKTASISIQTPGKYDILYSTETTYNGSSYKYIRTESTDTIDSVDISSKEDFLKCIDEWNLDSESSKYVVYNITRNIDFKGTEIPSVSVFNGTINGNGYTLSNITFRDEDGKEDIGLFKLVTKYATIHDLKIDNLTIEAKDSSYVGFIARSYGWLERITVSGTITGKEYVGGIVGYNGNYQTDSDTTSDSSVKYGYGVLKESENQATVYGEINVGGLAGFNGGKLITSWNSAEINVKSYSSSVTVTNIGGLAGYSTGEIVNSLNQAKVGYNGIANNVGGLCGLLNGEVYFSRNIAPVYGKNNVGGIAGYFGSESTDSDSKSAAVANVADADTLVNEFMGNEDSDSPAYEEQSDISNHCMYYTYNTGEVHGVRYAGGLLGYNNASALVLQNCLANADIYADSGSYAGGLVGYLNGGTLTSDSYNGYIEANGSVNRYVGGIAGYSAGKIEACTANATLNGGQYVGGIAGYVTSTGYVLSTYANVYMITETTNQYTGNIAGYIDGMDNSSGTYGDRVKYNYYMGSDLNDYSGINNVNYGKASHFAAQRILYSELLTDSFANIIKTKKFGLIDEDENTYYYEEGVKLPVLKNFYTCDVLDDDKFDDDTDSYIYYEEYFEKYKDELKTLEDLASRCVCRTIFKEWDPEIDDNEPDNYVVVDIEERLLGSEDAVTAPAIKYHEDNDATTSLRKDALYKVSWNNISSEFKNQTIYASYEEILNNYYDSDAKMYVEGQFTGADTVTITKGEGEIYKVTVMENGKEKTCSNLTVKVYCKNPERCYVTVYDKTVDGTRVTSRVYGDYIEFTLDNTSLSFKVTQGPWKLSMLPDYAIALMIIIPVFIVLVVLIVLSNLKNRKKGASEVKEKEDESENPSDDSESFTKTEEEMKVFDPEEAKEALEESLEDVSLEAPVKEEKPLEKEPEEEKTMDSLDNASKASASEKTSSETELKASLTPEEKKARQMENLRKARLAREANLKKQHPQE